MTGIRMVGFASDPKLIELGSDRCTIDIKLSRPPSPSWKRIFASKKFYLEPGQVPVVDRDVLRLVGTLAQFESGKPVLEQFIQQTNEAERAEMAENTARGEAGKAERQKQEADIAAAVQRIKF